MSREEGIVGSSVESAKIIIAMNENNPAVEINSL
jgi:hypothetical protein